MDSPELQRHRGYAPRSERQQSLAALQLSELDDGVPNRRCRDGQAGRFLIAENGRDLLSMPLPA